MKHLKLMLAMALVLVVVLALASCGCEHVYDETITTQPTCTEEGVKTFTCSLCGEAYTEAVAATGHTYTDKVVDPTCTAEGYTEHTCACGDTYKDSETAKVAHTYAETVTAPTCTVAGYTTYTCVCGDTYTGAETAATGVHVYVPTLVEMTAEQAALNPDAVGIVKSVCSCGAEDASAEQTAALVFLNFDETIDTATYVGSEAYNTLASGGSFKSEESKQAAAYLDSQKNLAITVANGNSTGAAITEDGKLVTLGQTQYTQLMNDLKLASVDAKYKNFTMSFDVTINKEPVLDSKNQKPRIIAITDEKFLNNKNIYLALDVVDLDTNADDDVKVYEVISQCFNENSTKPVLEQATGYKITLGKTYSFILDAKEADGIYTYTLYIKEISEATYTNVGTYEYIPYSRSDRQSFVTFSYKTENTGNIFDNFVISVPLAK